ncbi:PQQ-dependent dehydrogenase, methanol/ethanol family, partial [Pseudomonas sp. FW306-2-11BA]
MTYTVRGEQYVAVQAGYGGAAITVGPAPESSAASRYENINRIIAFKLDGPAVPLPPTLAPVHFEQPPEQHASEASI